MRTVLLATAVTAFTGCGTPADAGGHPARVPTEAASQHTRFEPPAVQWILPNRLPLTAQTRYERSMWPIYNTQLTMNRFPASWHGIDLVNTWRLPPGWGPYLLKHEKRVPEFVDGHRPLTKIPQTLYITLQGTVFLYPQTIMQGQWPPSRTVGDVPPTTVVAEFVPLRAAVQAGVIPESQGQPWLGGYLPAIWRKALGMTSTQISDAVLGHAAAPRTGLRALAGPVLRPVSKAPAANP